MAWRRAVLGSVVLVFLGAGAEAQTAGPLAILLPGAGGAVPSDFLIRNQGNLARAGIETAVAMSPAQASALASSAQQRGRRAVLVAMSQGASRAAAAIAAGAPVAGAVFVSANLDNVRAHLGSPGRLPRTLVIHHQGDECRLTPPGGVQPFAQWAGGRASIQWITTAGTTAPNPCGPMGAHGFYRQDGPAVSAIVAFLRGS